MLGPTTWTRAVLLSRKTSTILFRLCCWQTQYDAIDDTAQQMKWKTVPRENKRLFFYTLVFWKPLLGAFEKFRKATIRFVVFFFVCLSVRPSVRMEQLGSHWTDFHEIWHLIRVYFLENLSRNSLCPSTISWPVGHIPLYPTGHERVKTW